MRAAVLHSLNADLRIEDVPDIIPGPGEVLLRTLACGICRTDLHVQHGETYHPMLPHIPGHEPAGEVVAVGEGVTGWSPGDRSVPYLLEKVDTPNGPEVSVLGVTKSGAFSEFFIARADNLVPLPKGLAPELAGLAACAGVTTLHAINRGDINAGDRTAIIGAGGIGALMIQLLVSRDATVAAIDIRADILAKAEEEGAAHVFLVEQVTESMSGTFDRVFDLVGTSESTALAVRIVRDGGRIILLGEEADVPRVTTTEIAQRELEIVGSRNGTRDELAEVLGLLADGTLRPRIDSIIALEEVNDALARMGRGVTNGRIVIRF